MNPILTLLVLLGTLFARTSLHLRERQQQLHKLRCLGFPWAFLLQPYTFFVVALALYYTYSLCCFVTLLSKYSWLDPATFHRPPVNGSHVTEHQSELEAYTIPGWLGALCKVSPLFICVTFGVTMLHLWRHLPLRPSEYGEGLRWFPTFSHDLAMQVVALPLVYGIFALDNVVKALEVFTGQAYMDAKPDRSPGNEYDVWKSSVYLMQQAYETNFELADLYEAWALRCFGLLCFTLVRRQVLLEAPTVKYLIDTVKHHLTSVAAEDSHGVRVLKDLTLLENPQKLLFEPLQQTSRLGVMVFVYTYAVKSAYSLTLTFLAEPPFRMQLCGDNGALPAACSLRPYAEGAALLASTLAIMNIVLFEQNLKSVLKKSDFRPFAKFLAVKVLVSIVFIQQYGLEVLLGQMLKFSDLQISLCYACLICWEVLPLSLLVFYAWRPHVGDWYDGDLYSGIRGDAAAMARVELADEGGSFMTTDSFVRSRQPIASIAARSALPYELTAIIELRGDVKPQDGRALQDVVHALSGGRIRAEYKAAALYRDQGTPSGRRYSSGAALLASGGGPIDAKSHT